MITPAAITPQPLTERQRLVLAMIAQYYMATGEACSVRYLARRLAVHPSTIYDHLVALHKKGWIPAPAAPRPRRAGGSIGPKS